LVGDYLTNNPDFGDEDSDGDVIPDSVESGDFRTNRFNRRPAQNYNSSRSNKPSSAFNDPDSDADFLTDSVDRR